MRSVPYHGNPGNACALACYTMVAQYLLPNEDETFEHLGKIADWHKGYVVWAYPVWTWLMDKGIHITDHDLSDNDAWAREGIDGLRRSVSAKEFNFYEDNTYDLGVITKQLAAASSHPNFVYKRCYVTWDMIVEESNKSGICDLTLDGRKLNRAEGFSVHRVVLIDITAKEVIFHDPNKNEDGAYRHESIKHFRSAIEGLESPELTRYSLHG